MLKDTLINRGRRVYRKWSSVIDHIKLISSFPHIRMSVGILVLAFGALGVSCYLDRIDQAFWSSIFSNVFAGLVTGLVLCFVGGTKQTAIAKMQVKKAWLEKIKGMINQYFEDYHKLCRLRVVKFDCGNEEMFNFIYDVGSHANWINEEIQQRTFDKTMSFNTETYCRESFGYDAHLMSELFYELHEKLKILDIECPSSKEVIAYFATVHPEILKLNSGICGAIRDLEIRLVQIQKTII